MLKLQVVAYLNQLLARSMMLYDVTGPWVQTEMQFLQDSEDADLGEGPFKPPRYVNTPNGVSYPVTPPKTPENGATICRDIKVSWKYMNRTFELTHLPLD